ncbi:MAG: hypothetical protein H6718_21515 [Polyangiaceae bacterium]|nr:hypothetical protein [Polyangiaceae bacterium]
MGERWPGVYGEEELRLHIKELSQREFLEESFYEWRSAANLRSPNDLCQGDVVRIESDVPLIDAEGDPSLVERETDFWMVLGNSCDFDRELDDVEFTQIVPVEAWGSEIEATLLSSFRGFTQYRRFYLPDWRLAGNLEYFSADLTNPVTLHKAAFPEHVHLEARLSRAAWTLLNACLVRFVARSDGRND